MLWTNTFKIDLFDYNNKINVWCNPKTAFQEKSPLPTVKHHGRNYIICGFFFRFRDRGAHSKVKINRHSLAEKKIFTLLLFTGACKALHLRSVTHGCTLRTLQGGSVNRLITALILRITGLSTTMTDRTCSLIIHRSMWIKNVSVQLQPCTAMPISNLTGAVGTPTHCLGCALWGLEGCLATCYMLYSKYSIINSRIIMELQNAMTQQWLVTNCGIYTACKTMVTD